MTAAWFADVRRVIDLTEVTPGLPLPTISPARATYDYRHVVHAEHAREAVSCAVAVLSYVFGVTFPAEPRIVTHGADGPQYLLEAALPSGLALVIISRISLAEDPAERVPELAGTGVAA